MAQRDAQANAALRALFAVPLLLLILVLACFAISAAWGQEKPNAAKLSCADKDQVHAMLLEKFGERPDLLMVIARGEGMLWLYTNPKTRDWTLLLQPIDQQQAPLPALCLMLTGEGYQRALEPIQ
jgi:hypothetical protein